MKKIIVLTFIILSLFLIPVMANEIPDFIEIGINSSSLVTSVTVSSDGGIYTDCFTFADEDAERGEYAQYYIDDNVTVTVSENGTLVVNEVDTDEAVVDFFKETEFLTCNGKRYRGAIRLKVSYGKILIVNVLSMDEYLYGVVGREMSESFPLEALKAQAVAARNYTVISLGRHKSQGFDLCNGEHCQAYGGVASEGENVRRAVDETSGILLYYGDEVVQCYYCSSNGGHSENSENVWYATIPYLKGKTDPYEDGSKIPGYYWSFTYTKDEIKNHLLSKGVDIGEIEDIEITGFTKNMHVTEITIYGTDGKKVYTKDNIRSSFPDRFKSTHFTLSKGEDDVSVRVLTGDGMVSVKTGPVTVMTGNGIQKIKGKGKSGEFTFSGSGNGHGIGMSQYGAKFMAESGFTFEEILEFYFTDTEISDNERE